VPVAQPAIARMALNNNTSENCFLIQRSFGNSKIVAVDLQDRAGCLLQHIILLLSMINLDAGAFAAMQSEAFLINLSRGGRVVKEALKTGQIAGAGLDAFRDTPPDPADPLFACNVMPTPHIGGVTDLSMHGIVKVVAENIRKVAQNQKPLYSKNRVGGL